MDAEAEEPGHSGSSGAAGGGASPAGAGQQDGVGPPRSRQQVDDDALLEDGSGGSAGAGGGWDAHSPADGGMLAADTGQQQQQQQQGLEPGDDGGGWAEEGAGAGAAAQEQLDAEAMEEDAERAGSPLGVAQQPQQQLDERREQRADSPAAEGAQAAAGDGAAAEAAAEAAALEAQRRLNELEAVLRQADAVMEPGIMDRLREYVLANGHPRAAVEYLTDSYLGYAQMASLVCRWLEMTDGGADPSAGGDPPSATADAAGGGADSEAAAGARLDEAFYLRQLAAERFDPQHFATVFTSGGSGAPQWLNGLIATPEGRSLVYRLAGRYKNSLLLNFAIHKILMQPGREKEVAAVGGSLAGYFGVFHRLMAAKLGEVAAAADEAALVELARVLKEDVCASQHTYVHAQQVLFELAKHPRGARFRRLSQELEEHAAALHGPVVWKMRQWFAEPGQPEPVYQVAALLSDILASSVSGVPPASEMGKLFRLYWPQDEGQAPPPISLLRHPRVLEVLLHGLFSPGRQLPPEAQAAYSGLLALAAAADDRRGDDPSGGGGVGGLDLSAVGATRAAVEEAAELAQRVMQDQRSSGEDMERAAAVLEYPCCAAGLLHALRAQLTRPEYWQTAYHLLKAPPFLALLALLVPRQPALHEPLLRLLGDALTALGNANHDMAKGFLSVAVQLVSAGRVCEVLRWAEEWKQRADPSLVRHLVFGILEVAAPPYSPEFAGSMLRIMMAAGIRRQRLSARDWGLKALLDEFAAAAAAVQFKPPLSAREAHFLQDISTDRPPGY